MDASRNEAKTEHFEKTLHCVKSGPSLLRVTERIKIATGDVHPGWIKATSILLRGMERIRLQEATDEEPP